MNRASTKAQKEVSERLDAKATRGPPIANSSSIEASWAAVQTSEMQIALFTSPKPSYSPQFVLALMSNTEIDSV